MKLNIFKGFYSLFLNLDLENSNETLYGLENSDETLWEYLIFVIVFII